MSVLGRHCTQPDQTWCFCYQDSRLPHFLGLGALHIKVCTGMRASDWTVFCPCATRHRKINHKASVG